MVKSVSEMVGPIVYNLRRQSAIRWDMHILNFNMAPSSTMCTLGTVLHDGEFCQVYLAPSSIG